MSYYVPFTVNQPSGAILVAKVSDPGDLRAAWEMRAEQLIAWFRTPEHDSYWRYHREQFLELLPPPGRLTLDIGCGEGRHQDRASKRRADFDQTRSGEGQAGYCANAARAARRLRVAAAARLAGAADRARRGRSG